MTGRSENTTVNFVFQSPGGIGKTLVCSWVAEYLRDNSQAVICYDADPSRKVLAQIEALAARSIDLVYRDKSGQTRLNIDEMDSVFSEILEGDQNVVLDCGGAGYERVSSYLLSNGMIETLAEYRRVIIHVIIVGGRDHLATVKEFDKIIGQYPENVEKVAWINPHFGEVGHNGVAFTESSFFTDNADKIAGVLYMPELQADYTTDYFKTMVAERMTFSEILSPENKSWNAISKLRMRNIWNPIKKQLADVL